MIEVWHACGYGKRKPTMKTMRLTVPLLLLAALLFPGVPASAMISVYSGHSPVTLESLPKGAAELANLKSRFRLTEGPPFGGGEYIFEYRGGTASFQRALEALAAIRGPKRELVLCDGPGKMCAVNDDEQHPIDWTFTVWSPESYYAIFNRPDIGPLFDEVPNYGETVPPPRIHLYLWKDGRVDWRDVKVPAGIDVVDRRAESAKVKPEGGGLLIGTVYDMCTGRPVPGAVISLEQWRGDPKPEANTAAADEDGNFRIEHVQNGSFYIHAAADHYATRQAGCFHNEGQEFQEETIYLAPARTLEGKAVDSEGKPVAGVKIQVNSLQGIDGKCYPRPRKDGPACITSDENGLFRIPGLPQGYAHIMTFGEWQCEEQFRIYGTADPVVRSRNNEIRLTVLRTGEIHGHVVVPGGAALPANVEVRCFRLNNASADRLFESRAPKADKTFSQSGLLPGEYLVSVVDISKRDNLWKDDRPKLEDLVKAIEQAPGTKRVTLKPGGSVDVELTCGP